LRKITTIRTIGKFLRSEIELLEDYRAPKPERLTAHPLDGGMADVHKLISACKTGREQALVALCGFLGLRVGEAIVVTCDDFDFKDRTLMVRNGKGAKDRVIPVPQRAWRPIFAGINEQPATARPLVAYKNRNARRMLTEIGLRCGIELSSHDLRSTLLTAMYQASKDLRATQEFAGHSSSSTTEAYTGIRMKDMRDALAAI
jgi:integrase/recombinase XerD